MEGTAGWLAIGLENRDGDVQASVVRLLYLPPSIKRLVLMSVITLDSIAIIDKHGKLISVQPYENLIVAHALRDGHKAVKAFYLPIVLESPYHTVKHDTCLKCGCSTTAIRHFGWACKDSSDHAYVGEPSTTRPDGKKYSMVPKDQKQS